MTKCRNRGAAFIFTVPDRSPLRNCTYLRGKPAQPPGRTRTAPRARGGPHVHAGACVAVRTEGAAGGSFPASKQNLRPPACLSDRRPAQAPRAGAVRPRTALPSRLSLAWGKTSARPAVRTLWSPSESHCTPRPAAGTVRWTLARNLEALLTARPLRRRLSGHSPAFRLLPAQTASLLLQKSTSTAGAGALETRRPARAWPPEGARLPCTPAVWRAGRPGAPPTYSAGRAACRVLGLGSVRFSNEEVGGPGAVPRLCTAVPPPPALGGPGHHSLLACRGPRWAFAPWGRQAVSSAHACRVHPRAVTATVLGEAAPPPGGLCSCHDRVTAGTSGTPPPAHTVGGSVVHPLLWAVRCLLCVPTSKVTVGTYVPLLGRLHQGRHLVVVVLLHGEPVQGLVSTGGADRQLVNPKGVRGGRAAGDKSCGCAGPPTATRSPVPRAWAPQYLFWNSSPLRQVLRGQWKPHPQACVPSDIAAPAQALALSCAPHGSLHVPVTHWLQAKEVVRGLCTGPAGSPSSGSQGTRRPHSGATHQVPSRASGPPGDSLSAALGVTSMNRLERGQRLRPAGWGGDGGLRAAQRCFCSACHLLSSSRVTLNSAPTSPASAWNSLVS